ncbi:MAG: hypothetical protein AAGN46_01035 [Acidobacteriota bacterium]
MVRGRIVLSLVEVMGAFPSLARRILEENGLGGVAPDDWVPLDRWLACFTTVAERVGPNTVVAVGRHLGSSGPPPHDAETLEAAFAHLDEAYRSVHQGDVGHYHSISTGRRTLTIVASTPYPPSFDEGVIQALVERFEPDAIFDVRLDPSAESRRRGGASCTFLVTW